MSAPLEGGSPHGWRSEFELGVAELDRQHRDIVSRGSELHVAITDGAPKADVSLRLADFLHTVRSHFAWEEKLMLAHRYKGYGAHSAEHRRLADELERVELDFDAGLIESCGALAAFLEAWTVRHLTLEDRALARFLIENQ